MMKRFYLYLILFLSSFQLFAQKDNDVFIPIAKYIQSGDAGKLSAWFADNLELEIMGEVNDCSKTQATQIMKDFFERYKPKLFNIIHKSGSVPMKYAIGNLETENATFRITLFVKTESSGNYIQQIRIEKDSK